MIPEKFTVQDIKKGMQELKNTDKKCFDLLMKENLKESIPKANLTNDTMKKAINILDEALKFNRRNRQNQISEISQSAEKAITYLKIYEDTNILNLSPDKKYMLTLTSNFYDKLLAEGIITSMQKIQIQKFLLNNLLT